MVNDCMSDEERHQLAVLIPDVVGLTSDDVRLDARIALRCAKAALPIAPADLQNALAVSILTSDSVLAGLDNRPVGELEAGSREALESAPGAASWAHAFVRQAGITLKGYRRHAAPSTVRVAVRAIAEAGIDDPDSVLRQLLTGAIDDCLALCAPDATQDGAEAGAPAYTKV
jgi:hypothetical protein